MGAAASFNNLIGAPDAKARKRRTLKSHAQDALLFANGQDGDFEWKKVPLWMSNHYVLLYNGVPIEENLDSKSGKSRSVKESSVAVTAEAEESPETIAEMFHGYFTLAEQRRRKRIEQQSYPFF